MILTLQTQYSGTVKPYNFVPSLRGEKFHHRDIDGQCRDMVGYYWFYYDFSSVGKRKFFPVYSDDIGSTKSV